MSLFSTRGERERHAIRARIIRMSNDVPIATLTLQQFEELQRARSYAAGGLQASHLREIEAWLTPLLETTKAA